ncbi:hypothetical protein GOODEAATRI_001718 [Goodea atripinnis]|uniref:Secreted protein n=1 Tax=Goodea atripinnis TaxID=208336 RepID=A0ABV0PAK4_9TELE
MLYFYFFACSLQNLILGEFRRSGRSNERHTFGFPLPTDERAKIFQSCGFTPGCASSVASPSLSKKDRTPNWQSPGSVCGRTRSFSPEGLRAPQNVASIRRASQVRSFCPLLAHTAVGKCVVTSCVSVRRRMDFLSSGGERGATWPF